MTQRSSAPRSPRGLARLSIEDLQAEIRRRGKGVNRLQRKRDRLLKQIDAIDRELRAHGHAAGRMTSMSGRRTRPRNEMSLVDALHKVLDGKTMSVTEVAEAVQKAGYQSSAANFRTIVNAALITSGKFKRVSRGQYTAK